MSDRAARPSLRHTVMKVAAAAAAAATLLWSVLFFNALNKHAAATATAAHPAATTQTGQPGQNLAPVTTSTS